MATIKLDRIKKSFGSVDVIHGVDIDIKDGEFIVIVGPSGCGKSTLLRMVAGLETVTEGELQIDGVRVNDTEPMDRDIAMVFQNYALYPHMSVFENMAYGLKIAKTPKSEIQDRVTTAAKMLQLEDYLQRRPRELSGGQRQRVAMGRAIVREPKVFLFDEPLSNLDAKLRVQMRLQIKTLQKNLGITSVYVTHDQVEAMTLGHRLAVLNGGYVEQLGTPIDIYEEPASVFVAGFIGSPSMNLISATLDAKGDNAVIGGKFTVALRSNVKSHAGKSLTFGIRPEHITVNADDSVGIPLNVQIVEQLGADTLIHGTLPDGTPMIVRQDGVRKLSTSETLSLSFEPAAIHLFDSETERRIKL